MVRHDYTIKQVNVIFGAAKRKDITLEKWIISNLYSPFNSDYKSPYENCLWENVLVSQLVEAIFEKRFEDCAEYIESYMSHFYLKKMDRSLL